MSLLHDINQVRLRVTSDVDRAVVGAESRSNVVGYHWGGVRQTVRLTLENLILVNFGFQELSRRELLRHVHSIVNPVCCSYRILAEILWVGYYSHQALRLWQEVKVLKLGSLAAVIDP